AERVSSAPELEARMPPDHSPPSIAAPPNAADWRMKSRRAGFSAPSCRTTGSTVLFIFHSLVGLPENKNGAAFHTCRRTARGMDAVVRQILEAGSPLIPHPCQSIRRASLS